MRKSILNFLSGMSGGGGGGRDKAYSVGSISYSDARRTRLHNNNWI